MTKTADVAYAGQILASWGNEIRDRSWQKFDSVAQRDSQWSNAPDGSFCITTDAYTAWVRRNGAWAPFGYDTWGSDWGVVGTPQAFTSNSPNVGVGAYSNTGWAITFTPVVGRRYKIVFETIMNSNTAGAQLVTSIRIGGSTVQAVYMNVVANNALHPMQATYFLDAASASPVTAEIWSQVSAGTAFHFAVSSAPSRLWVEDCGPIAGGSGSANQYNGLRLPWTPILRVGGSIIGGNASADLSRNGDRVNGEVDFQTNAGASGTIVIDWPNNWRPNTFWSTSYLGIAAVNVSGGNYWGFVQPVSDGLTFKLSSGSLPALVNGSHVFMQFSYLSTT